MAGKTKLDKDEMLQSEFKYITQTAFQANEDRSRFSSYYFVTVGSFVAAVLGSPTKPVALAFFILFMVLTVMGWLTIAQLGRLRASWHESAQAMNQIKNFYIKNHPEIKPAFKWLDKQIPDTNKRYSIANLIAIEVILLSSLTTGAGVYYLLTVLDHITLLSWSIVAISVAIGWALQWEWYKRRLVDDR